MVRGEDDQRFLAELELIQELQDADSARVGNRTTHDLEGFQHARAKGGRFALLAPSESVRAVLELARLDRVFPIFSDLAAARAA